jgi:membrane protein
MPEKIENRLRIIYELLNERTFGVVRILRIAIYNYGESNATQSAAGMAYYAFFSLFPLLLFLIVGASYILEVQSAYNYVIENVYRVLPTAQNLIDANLQQVFDSRGAVGLVGLVGFLWSSTSFFSILTRNINRANPNSTKRGFFEDRVVALGMIGLLALLLGLSLLSNTITGLLPNIDIIAIRGTPIHETIVWRYLIKLVPYLITLLLLTALYRYIPKEKVGWKGVLIAAPLSALLWQGVTKLFTWLIQGGLVQYELIYGSLGTLAGLLFWLYLISLITIFGAHLSAVIDLKISKH